MVRFVLVASAGAFVLLGAIAWICFGNLAAAGWRVDGHEFSAVFGSVSSVLLIGFLIVVPLILVRSHASQVADTPVTATVSGIRMGNATNSLVVSWDDIAGWRNMTLPGGEARGGVVVVRIGDPERREQVAALLPGAQDGDEIVLGSLSGPDLQRWTTLASTNCRR
jgi:hypothetical protein